MAQASWYKLDNVGKFYAAQAGNPTQTVFRFAGTMSEPIDPACLQTALTRSIERFPSFNVELRSGFFWHYLVESAAPPQVEPETLPICMGLYAGPHSVLFRVSYYQNRINLEVSHMVSDGRGTLEFFKTLIGAYVEVRYKTPAIPASEMSGSTDALVEDSYTKNYERHLSGSTNLPKAYRLTGWRDETAPTYFAYHLPADEVHALAKSMDVSITSLLIAVVIKAIGASANMTAAQKSRSICLDVPVDLRRLYGSSTMRNFFGLAYVAYPLGDSDKPLDHIARVIQEQIISATDTDVLKKRMNRMVKLEKNPALRIAPLFLKDAVLSIAASISARDVTTTFSSLGRIDINDNIAPYLREICALTSTVGLNFAACTCGNDLCVGISSLFVSHNIVRDFCRIFSLHGICGRLDCSKSDKDNEYALRQAAFEARLTRTKQARHASERGAR